MLLIKVFILIFFLQGCSEDAYHISKTKYNDRYFDLIDLNVNISELNDLYNVKVGIIDSGFNFNHPLLNLNSVNNTSFYKKIESHGNIVAGIIGAKKNNDNKFTGLIPDLELYVYDLKSEELNIEKLTNAIKKFTDLKVDIINISLSTLQFDEKLYNATKEAVDAGIVIVASSGNSGNETYNYPASFDIPGVISVGAINSENNILSSSTTNDSVDIWAPGEKIVSLTNTNNNIDTYNGTSVSTPIVTSLVILLKAKCYPEMNPVLIEDFVKKGALTYKGKWRNLNKGIYLVSFKNSLNLCNEFINKERYGAE